LTCRPKATDMANRGITTHSEPFRSMFGTILLLSLLASPVPKSGEQGAGSEEQGAGSTGKQ
jgi:hypothetical protein